MAGLKKKKRIKLVLVGLSLLAIASVLIGFGLKNWIDLFQSPTQIVAAGLEDGKRFKMGGMVMQDSWERGETHHFVITDFVNEIPVSYNGIIPDLFGEGQGTIVTGALFGGTFVATEVLAKHDEQYMPAELVDTLPAEVIEAMKENGYYEEPDS